MDTRQVGAGTRMAGARSRTSWRTVLQRAAVAGVVEAAIVMGIVERALIPPALFVAVLLLVGAILLRGTRRGGVWVTTVAFGLFLLTNLAFTGPGLRVAASFWSFAVTWVSIATAAVGVIAGIATWRDRAASAAATRVVLASAGVAVVAVVLGLVASLGFTDAKPASGDISVKASHSKFPATLIASNGQVTFFLDNADNTLHDFHIVGVKGGDKDMPANHQIRLTVALTSGTYKFECDLHNNMKGTLTVR